MKLVSIEWVVVADMLTVRVNWNVTIVEQDLPALRVVEYPSDTP
jgi:hypothetical protein